LIRVGGDFSLHLVHKEKGKCRRPRGIRVAGVREKRRSKMIFTTWPFPQRTQNKRNLLQGSGKRKRCSLFGAARVKIENWWTISWVGCYPLGGTGGRSRNFR